MTKKEQKQLKCNSKGGMCLKFYYWNFRLRSALLGAQKCFSSTETFINVMFFVSIADLLNHNDSIVR